MYSVLQIIIAECANAGSRSEALRDAVSNNCSTSVTSGGIAIIIADTPDLIDHFISLRDVLSKTAHILCANLAEGGNAHLDTAIYPEEYSGRLLTELVFPSDVMRVLVASNIDWVISVYGSAELLLKSEKQ